MLKRLTLVALAVALAAPAAASAEVTIKLGGGREKQKYREVLYDDGFRIKGKTGIYEGPVALEVDGFPFDGAYTDYGPTVETNSRGEYVFPNVVLGRNARVRVRAGSERSGALTLFVHPGVKHTHAELSRDRMRISFTYLGHPGFAPPPNAFYVYVVVDHEPGFHRLRGPLTMTQIGDGRWRYRAVLKEPRARRYWMAYCTKGLSAAGYGRFWPIDVGCGKKVIR